MKKRNPFVTALFLIIVLSTACHYHHGHRRTISVNNDDISLKIEYCGDIIFNNDETAIEEISPGGYVKYKKNGKRLIAESNEDGSVYYKIAEDGHRWRYEQAQEKEFIANIVQEIAEHYDR